MSYVPFTGYGREGNGTKREHRGTLKVTQVGTKARERRVSNKRMAGKRDTEVGLED